MTVTLRGMIDSGEIAHTETRDEPLAAIAGILARSSGRPSLSSIHQHCPEKL